MKRTDLTTYLDDLESRIDNAVEEQLFEEAKIFAMGKWQGPYFQQKRKKYAPPKIQWPKVHINDAINDFPTMALHQLCEVSNQLASGNAVLSVRCNYGTPILPSLFGVEIIESTREMNTLPGCKPLGRESIEKMINLGIPHLKSGLGGKVLEMAKIFVDLFEDRPLLKKHIHIYHPDLQGPIDALEMIWGSEIFLDFFDEADLIHKALTLVSDTYIAFMNEVEKIVPPKTDGVSVHWGHVHKGRILTRVDSAMNLSPEMFDTFVLPYEKKILNTYGGGMHACGKVDHYIDRLDQIEGLSAFNMSQPHMNDMEKVYKNTVDKGIVIIGLNTETVEYSAKIGRDLKGKVQCW